MESTGISHQTVPGGFNYQVFYMYERNIRYSKHLRKEPAKEEL